MISTDTDGFSTTVEVLDLRPGGALVCTIAAAGREQVAAAQRAGLPLSAAATDP